VQNDEWNSTAPECVTTDGGTQFTVASSSISEPANGAPGGYPSIFSGCSARVCTVGNKMPNLAQRCPGMLGRLRLAERVAGPQLSSEQWRRGVSQGTWVQTRGKHGWTTAPGTLR